MCFEKEIDGKARENINGFQGRFFLMAVWEGKMEGRAS